MAIEGDLSQRFKQQASPKEQAAADVRGVTAQIILEELFGKSRVDRLYTLGLNAEVLGKLARPETLSAIAQKHGISREDAKGAVVDGVTELSAQLGGAEAAIGQRDPIFEATRRKESQVRYWK